MGLAVPRYFLLVILQISSQYNIPNGNQRGESWALVCFPYRSFLEGHFQNFPLFYH
jgi:hypothetical protein